MDEREMVISLVVSVVQIDEVASDVEESRPLPRERLERVVAALSKRTALQHPSVSPPRSST
jgi:hypothetical protein